jgi:hypothetical protein
MKKLTMILGFLVFLIIPTQAIALDSFLSYRNLSPVGDEHTATTPDANFAIKRGIAKGEIV